MFDVLITLIGNVRNEADALALVQDLEDGIRRARHLGLSIEIRDSRLAQVVRKQMIMPDGAGDFPASDPGAEPCRSGRRAGRA